MPVFFDRHLLSIMMIIIVPGKIRLFKVDLLHLYRFVHLVWGTMNNNHLVMAKPIKETPVLYGEDAYRFEMAVRNVVPLSDEEREEILRDYEEVKKHCTFL